MSKSDGEETPLSKLLMVWRVRFTMWASCSWETPTPLRISLIL